MSLKHIEEAIEKIASTPKSLNKVRSLLEEASERDLKGLSLARRHKRALVKEDKLNLSHSVASHKDGLGKTVWKWKN